MLSFRNVSVEALRLGEPPARRGQNSPMDTLLKRPTREPRPPARRAYAPEGTEKKPIVFRSRGVMQRSHFSVIHERHAHTLFSAKFLRRYKIN
ncbi:MAG: hypothetical protein R6T98_09460 [Desulfatiglandales bacterium]